MSKHSGHKGMQRVIVFPVLIAPKPSNFGFQLLISQNILTNKLGVISDKIHPDSAAHSEHAIEIAASRAVYDKMFGLNAESEFVPMGTETAIEHKCSWLNHFLALPLSHQEVNQLIDEQASYTGASDGMKNWQVVTLFKFNNIADSVNIEPYTGQAFEKIKAQFQSHFGQEARLTA